MTQLERLLPDSLVLQLMQDKAEESNTEDDTSVTQVQVVALLEELLPPHDTGMGCRNNSY